MPSSFCATEVVLWKSRVTTKSRMDVVGCAAISDRSGRSVFRRVRKVVPISAAKSDFNRCGKCARRGKGTTSGKLRKNLTGKSLLRAFLFRRRLQHAHQIESLLSQHRLPQVAELLCARDDVVDAKVFDLHAALDLFPRHRRRHAGHRRRANRVDRCERAAPRVLVVIDEHASVRPFHLAVLGRDDVGMTRLQLDRDRLRERPHFFLQRSAHDRDVDVNPF